MDILYIQEGQFNCQHPFQCKYRENEFKVKEYNIHDVRWTILKSTKVLPDSNVLAHTVSEIFASSQSSDCLLIISGS